MYIRNNIEFYRKEQDLSSEFVSTKLNLDLSIYLYLESGFMEPTDRQLELMKVMFNISSIDDLYMIRTEQMDVNEAHYSNNVKDNHGIKQLSAIRDNLNSK